MNSAKRKLLLATAALCLGFTPRAKAGLSFYVDPNSPWPGGWYDAAVANMQTVVNMYNAYGDFGNGSIYVYYNAGIPTAQSGYGGWGGSIGDGGTYPNVRVLLHESSHWLGTGTYSANWGGPNATALIQQFDGVGARLNGDGAHYWPYGENYDNESSPVNDARHVAMVYALREDFGIGSTARPSTATAVHLTASDAPGTSGFNYPFGWSDTHFAQAGTAYSTGDFALRTPNGYPSWTFAGASLTVNNKTNPNGGLLFNGYGNTGIVTINNLIVDGGTVRHDQFPQDLFQLAGRVTLASSATFNAANGDIKILAPIGGSGSLIKTGGYTLTLTGANTYTGTTIVNTGRLVLNKVGLANGSGLTVASGAAVGVIGNVATGGTLNASGTVDLADGALNTHTISGGINLNNATLNLDLGGAGADRIAAAGVATLGGTTKVNFTPVGGQSVTDGSSYTILTAAGGGLDAARFAIGAKPASLGFYQLGLSTPTPNALLLNVTGNPTPAVAYWTGKASATSGDSANNWGTGPNINTSNWSTDAAGATDPLQLPGSTTNVIFNAANATGVGATLTTRIDSSYAVGGVTFDIPAAPGITSTVLNTNGNTLAIGSGGVKLASTSNSSVTVNGAGTLGINASQAWANNSNVRALTINSGIAPIAGAATLTLNGTGTGGVTLGGTIADGPSGALSLVFNQAGTTTLTAPNTFTGSVTINGGTVYANPGNAANNRAFSYVSGITVNGGATLRSGANGLFGWDGSQEHPITVNAGGTLAALGTPTTDVALGLVTLNGGTISALGTTATDYGSFRFDDAASKLRVTDNSVVSAQHVKFGNAAATIEVAAGKTLNFTGTVTDATSGGISYLNKSGTGTLLMAGASTYTGDTTVSAGTLSVSGSITASPNVNVNTGGILNVSGTLTDTTTNINTGSLVVSGKHTASGNVFIGQGSGGNGTLNVQSGGNLTANVVIVGAGGSPTAVANGTGNLASGGTITTSQWFVVGQSGAAGSNGTFTVNGGTLNVHTNAAATGNLEVGTFDAANATLNVNTGSNVKLLSNAVLVFGAQAGQSGTGTVNQNGGNVTFYADGGTTVGGTGRLALASAGNPTGHYTYNLNGGTLTVPRVARDNTANNPTTTFNFNGGTLRPTANSTTFLQGLSAANVRAGGAIVDTGGFAVTIPQSLLHDSALGASADGGLTKNGAGVLTLTASNTFTGPTTVNAGTLRVTGSVASSSGVTTANSGVFEAATPQVIKSLAVTAGQARVTGSAAGGVPYALTVGDNAAAGNPVTITSGQLDLTTNGLVVRVAPGAQAAALQSLRQQIVTGYNSGDWAGSGVTSATAAADKSRAIGYALATELPAPTSFLGATTDDGSVVARLTLAGDANLDGSVDFNDLVKLAQNYNANVSPTTESWWTHGDFTFDGNVDFNDLVKLAQNYNAALPTEPIPGAPADFQADLARAFASVPEPTAAPILVSLAALGTLKRRRRRD